jgi:hypothetical protein
MTTFRTYINGLPFEICVDRGLHIEVESNGITVTRCEGEGPKVTSGNVIPFVPRPLPKTGTDDGPNGHS